MPTRTVTVGSRIGLHARPAAQFVKAASSQPVPVRIAKPGRDPVDANSILMVLTLDVRGGEQVTLSAEGEGADEALDALADLVARDPDAGA